MRTDLLAEVAAVMTAVAAAEVMPRWRNLGATDVAEKSGPDDIVTIADQAAETALAAALGRLLPEAAVVGEEAVAGDARVLDRLRGRGPVWVIDPIDGTSAFAAGEPDFALMVGLVEDGRPVAGWICAPALGEITYGAEAAGTWQGRNGAAPQPLAPRSAPARLNHLTGLLGKRNITPERRAELKAKESSFKALDSVICAGLDYARIARGDADFALYSKSEPWDHLPGLGLLAGLGFTAAKHDGSPYRPGDNSGGLLVAPSRDLLERIRVVMLG